MQTNWNDKDPIYRQLHDRMIEMMLEGVFCDGDGLPSVRQLASEYRINPITVSRAMQLLVDEGVAEKRRGLGMFVTLGASERLKQVERQRFLDVEWPQILQKIERLGLTSKELLQRGPA